MIQVISNFGLEYSPVPNIFRDREEKSGPMDSLNFFFGLKATKTPEYAENLLTGTAIVYMSKHGTTAKVALLIKELLMDEDITLVNLDQQDTVDFTHCERIIIGGSIHMGQIQKPIYQFCRQYAEVLKSKKLGLFLCCMYDGEKAREQFNNAFPQDVMEVAKSQALMGYELCFEKMNLIERTMTKKISGYTESISHINQKELNRFIEELRS